MFVLKNLPFGFMRIDYEIPQVSSAYRFRFNSDLEVATQFASQTIAGNAAADYGQRWERRFPCSPVPRLVLCRVEVAGLRVVECF